MRERISERIEKRESLVDLAKEDQATFVPEFFVLLGDKGSVTAALTNQELSHAVMEVSFLADKVRETIGEDRSSSRVDGERLLIILRSLRPWLSSKSETVDALVGGIIAKDFTHGGAFSRKRVDRLGLLAEQIQKRGGVSARSPTSDLLAQVGSDEQQVRVASLSVLGQRVEGDIPKEQRRELRKVLLDRRAMLSRIEKRSEEQAEEMLLVDRALVYDRELGQPDGSVCRELFSSESTWGKVKLLRIASGAAWKEQLEQREWLIVKSLQSGITPLIMAGISAIPGEGEMSAAVADCLRKLTENADPRIAARARSALDRR
jgi:hypothetical protein